MTRVVSTGDNSSSSNSKSRSRNNSNSGEQSQVEEELRSDNRPVPTVLEKPAPQIQVAKSMPGEKKRKSGLGQSSSQGSQEGTFNGGSPRENGEEWVEMNGFSDDSGGKKGKGKLRNKSNTDTPIITNLSNGSLAMSGSDNNYHRGYSNGGHTQISGYEYRHNSSFDYELDDPGPHREMAIDVPENFVASVKSPPRYPPPSSTSSTPRSLVASPAKKSHNKGDKSQSQTSLNSAGSSLRHGGHIEPTVQELERMHRLEEELKKRREEESRQQAEQDFLRASLRGSKKLQALENKKVTAPVSSGFVNTAFDDEDDDEDDGIDNSEGKSYGRGGRFSGVVEEERYLKKNIEVEDLFSSLHHVHSRLTAPEDQKYLSFLRNLFQNEQFQQAVKMHKKVVDITSRSPPVRPVSEDAVELSMEMQYHSSEASPHNMYSQELFILLNKPHIKSLLEAHDAVSQQMLRPSDDLDLPPDALDYPLMQYGEDSVKIIHLEKTNDPLGATVKNEGDSVIIGRIVKGGAAEKSGLLHEGDEILDVNGIDMRGRNINDVSEMLANMTGIITFMIIPSHHPAGDNMQRPKTVMHLRALFSYDPEDDPYIPCRELGISFLKGDILHAIALDDPNWWQAFREGEEDDQSLAGLIPSKSFTEQRETMRNAVENKENKRKDRVCACGRKERKKKRKKKSLYSGSDETDEILTYEEIAKYYPQPNRKRPIVLIGPTHVGLGELQQRLLDSDVDRFGVPIPHTTRPRKNEEVDGSNYHYVTRTQFIAMSQQNRFIEYGEHQKEMFGTSVEAIRSIVAQGKVCLLILQPQTLKLMRGSDLKPYVIFVCPPNLEKLRQLQEQLDREARSRPLEDPLGRGRGPLNDDQLKSIIDDGRDMEEAFGHLFDYVLVNSDVDRAYQELLEEINRIEMEPQWVPAAWIDQL